MSEFQLYLQILENEIKAFVREPPQLSGTKLRSAATIINNASATVQEGLEGGQAPSQDILQQVLTILEQFMEKIRILLALPHVSSDGPTRTCLERNQQQVLARILWMRELLRALELAAQRMKAMQQPWNDRGDGAEEFPLQDF